MYKGGWENGQQHGKGAFISSSGKERNGTWENGTRTQWND